MEGGCEGWDRIGRGEGDGVLGGEVEEEGGLEGAFDVEVVLAFGQGGEERVQGGFAHFASVGAGGWCGGVGGGLGGGLGRGCQNCVLLSSSRMTVVADKILY